MSRLFRGTAAAFCLLLGLGTIGCTNRGSPAPLWLAQIATLSGPHKGAGESAARGIRLAVEEINQNVDQRPQLKVIHSDTHGQLEAFESEAVRLVTVNHVAFLLGGTTPEEVDRLDRAHATLVTPCGTRPRGVSEAVFSTGLTPSLRARSLARFVAEELRAATVLLVVDERRESLNSLAEALARELPLTRTKDRPAPLVRRLALGKSIKDGEFAAVVQQAIKTETVTAILVVGLPEMLGELGEANVPVLFAGHEVATKNLAAHGRKEIYCVTAFAGDEEPRAKEFAARYQKAFGEEPDVHAALAYEDVKILHEAIAKGKDTPRIRDELLQLKDFPALGGNVAFSKERQLQRPAFVVRIEGEAVKTVKRYPSDNG